MGKLHKIKRAFYKLDDKSQDRLLRGWYRGVDVRQGELIYITEYNTHRSFFKKFIKEERKKRGGRYTDWPLS